MISTPTNTDTHTHKMNIALWTNLVWLLIKIVQYERKTWRHPRAPLNTHTRVHTHTHTHSHTHRVWSQVRERAQFSR